MKARLLGGVPVVLGVVVAITMLIGCQSTTNTTQSTSDSHQASHQHRQAGTQQPAASQPAATSTPRVPAHYQTVADLNNLPPTLPPSQFFGQARLAYQAAKEIPKTIAQLPCYCYCDASFGHKSLHSCFQDNHAAQCAVCVDEALLAYRLEKEQGLTAPQIRERIIAQHATGK